MGLESKLESKLRTSVKKLGGIAFKFSSPSFAGVPDRIVLMPAGKLWFIEMKAPGKKPEPLQRAVHRIIEKLGFSVLTIDTEEKLNNFLNEI